MKTYSRLQIGALLKAIILTLLLFTVLWSIASLMAVGDILIGPLLFVNVGLSLVVGWFFYRNRYHEQLSFGPEGFEYRRGAYRSRRRWEDFDRVSLVHSGGGQFQVRLYLGAEADGGAIEIPASRMGLNASGFRFEAMKLIAAARESAGVAPEGGPGDGEPGPEDGPDGTEG